MFENAYTWILSVTKDDMTDKDIRMLINGFNKSLNIYKHHTTENNTIVINHIKYLLNE